MITRQMTTKASNALSWLSKPKLNTIPESVHFLSQEGIPFKPLLGIITHPNPDLESL